MNGLEIYIQAAIACILGIIGWGGKKVLARLDEIEELLASEVKALRDMAHHMDVRLTRVEERCQIVHNKLLSPNDIIER